MNTKFTPSINHIADDEDKNTYIGATIVETISKDPLMQRGGIVLEIKDSYDSMNHCNLPAVVIYWQPSISMPYHRPYRSMHILETLREHYFIKQG